MQYLVWQDKFERGVQEHAFNKMFITRTTPVWLLLARSGQGVLLAGSMVGSSALLQQRAFCGSTSALGRSNGSRISAFFKVRPTLHHSPGMHERHAPPHYMLVWGKQGGTKELKKAAAPVKKAAPSIKKAIAAPIKKAVPKESVGTQKVGTKRTGRKSGGEFPVPCSPCCPPSMMACPIDSHAQVTPCGCPTLSGQRGSMAACQVMKRILSMPVHGYPVACCLSAPHEVMAGPCSWQDWAVSAGDRGFDPLGLAKPTEYLQVRACTFGGPMHRDCDFCLWNRSVLLHCLQVGLDQLDQNAAVNKAGAIVGKFAASKTKLTDTALQVSTKQK